MARIVSIFQFTGRVGSAVGSKGKGGKVLLRQYQPTVTNPRTPAQMSQRAKMKLAAQVAGMLGEVGRTALIANGQRKTERGMLIKRLLQHIKVNTDGSKATLAYELNLVDNPNYAEAISLTVTSETNSFTATFTGASSGEVIAKCILVHDLKTGSWRHASALDTNTVISIGKSANESDDELEVFAYGIVLQPKTTEGINNVGQTGADSEGYVVDLNKVSTTNYNFSPTISAALSVGAKSSTETGNTNGSGETPSGGSTGNDTTNAVTVEAPEISGSTPFTGSTQVTITGPSGAEIHYTLDGNTPTAESTLYSEPFTLSDNTTVRAIAIKDGVSSEVTLKYFTKNSGEIPGNE